MRADRFASCEIIVPWLQNPLIFPSSPGLVLKSPWIKFSTASAKEFYSRFYYNEGLENKLTRCPLLGLAKSILFLIKVLFFKANELELLSRL